MKENPNQGSAHTESTVGDQTASETVTENINAEEKSGNIPSYEWHRRVLSDAKKYKTQLNETQDKLKAYEEKEMEATGKHQDLIAALREENQKLKSGIDERDQVYTWSKRSEALRHAATREGCVKPDHLLKLMDQDVLNQIQVDDSYNPVMDDVHRVVDSFKGNPDYQYLFRAKAHSVDTVSPQAKIEKEAPKKLREIPLAERIKMLDLGQDPNKL